METKELISRLDKISMETFTIQKQLERMETNATSNLETLIAIAWQIIDVVKDELEKFPF